MSKLRSQPLRIRPLFGLSAPSVAILALIIIGMGIATRTLVAQRPQDCAVCHRSIHQDWLQSRHSKAWKSPTFQTQLKQFGNREFCGSCHAPEAVWKRVDMQPGLGETPTFQALLANRATFRGEYAEDGVACSSCHFIEVIRPKQKGTDFIGPYHSTAGHGGTEVADFRSFRLCGACHGRPPADYQPGSTARPGFHHSETRDFDFAFEKSDCAGCHMPARQETLVQLKAFKNLPERRVGEHTFAGKRYQQLDRGLELTLAKEGAATVLSITNAKIGHPLRISTDTSYRIDFSLMKGDEAVETRSVPLEQAESLRLGETLKLKVPFDNPAPGALQVEMYRKEGELWETPVLTKRF